MGEQAPAPRVHVPWRQVVGAFTQNNGSVGVLLLELECGHTVPWAFGDLPFATMCPTCDPPMFHGKPWPPET